MRKLTSQGKGGRKGRKFLIRKLTSRGTYKERGLREGGLRGKRYLEKRGWKTLHGKRKMKTPTEKLTSLRYIHKGKGSLLPEIVTLALVSWLLFTNPWPAPDHQ